VLSRGLARVVARRKLPGFSAAAVTGGKLVEPDDLIILHGKMNYVADSSVH
jgi:hypothetical protein